MRAISSIVESTGTSLGKAFSSTKCPSGLVKEHNFVILHGFRTWTRFYEIAFIEVKQVLTSAGS